MKEKNVYYCVGVNDNGCVLQVGTDTSVNNLAKQARAQLGSGWKVEIFRKEDDGQPVMVKTFRIR